MPLTPRESFKVAFLLRCAEEGLTMEQTHERVRSLLEKAAGLNDIAGEAWSWAKWPVLAALIAPPAIGSLAGAVAGKADDTDQIDIETAKQQELIAEYRRLADRARRRESLQRYRTPVRQLA